MHIWTNANIYIQFNASTSEQNAMRLYAETKPDSREMYKIKTSRAPSCVSQIASCEPVPGTCRHAKRTRIEDQV
jgi:hypothetical protein